MLLFSCVMAIGDKRDVLAAYDTTPPIIGKAEIIETEVFAPGFVTVKLSDIIEEDTGISQITVTISPMGNNWRYGPISEAINLVKPLYSGDIYNLIIPINSLVDTGEYYISEVSVTDVRDNWRCYSIRNYLGMDTYDLNKLKDSSGDFVCNTEGKTKIYNTEFDLDISASNPFILNKITQMEDGNTVNILFDNPNERILPKTAFDAIKGTDKKLLAEVSNGIQWIFNGKDIINETKDIDCRVNVYKTDASVYNTNTEVLKIDFSTNGVLPGKATIKIKSDYIYNLHNLSNELYLYYLNSDKTLKLEDNPKYILDGTDHWCEFEVTHNSSFLVSGKQLTTIPTATTETINKEIKLNYSNIILQLTKTKQLKIISKESADTVKSYKSSNTKIATVSSKGKITARKKGSCTITVIMKSGKKATCKVKVVPLATSKIKFAKKSVTLKKGKTLTLKYTRTPKKAGDKLTWKSSKPKIVKVTSKGKVKGLKKGTSTITVMAASGKKASIKIKVK